MANYTSIADMQIVPEKFSAYVADRATALNTFVNSGIASPDATVGQLINGTPEGGRFIQLPMWNPLDGEEDTFSEKDLTIGKVTTKEARATLLVRGKAWGASDLSRVMGGADPMGAIISLLGDWRNGREQAIFLAELKGILDPSSGALKDHVNDISGGSGEAACISRDTILDTKQLLGDHHKNLAMVFMHSATYTYLQKKELILRQPWVNPAGETVEIETFMGYRVVYDDGMPVTPEGVYDTYILGRNCFIRQEGTPAGLVNTETDRDKLGSKNYIINRWCQVIHPRGLSWISEGTYTDPDSPYPANVDLSAPANWKLVVDHKKVGIAALRHKLN
jgi:hypothetical protein